MNETQSEIVAFNFGLFFSYGTADVFLEYIAPTISQTATSEVSPILTILIGLIALLSSLLTLYALIDIGKKIHWTINNPHVNFDWYMTKNVVVFFISFFAFAILKRMMFG